MQLRLPVVVIGGGLTAIDTATEALAYYPVQVEKFLARYEALVGRTGSEDAVRAAWSPDEQAIADEFLEHARAIRAERAARVARAARARTSSALLDRWGGVTIAYRRRLDRQPVVHAEPRGSREGAGGGHPLRRRPDADRRRGRCARPRRGAEGLGAAATRRRRHDPRELPARTILVAAGTQPNTMLAREQPAHFALDGKYFRLLDEEGRPVTPVKGLAKPAQPAVLTELRADGRAMSFFGDLHPSWAGNVVKAMASATIGYPIVSRVLDRVPTRRGDRRRARSSRRSIASFARPSSASFA